LWWELEEGAEGVVVEGLREGLKEQGCRGLGPLVMMGVGVVAVCRRLQVARLVPTGRSFVLAVAVATAVLLHPELARYINPNSQQWFVPLAAVVVAVAIPALQEVAEEVVISL
jgi:hypothetical protein